MLRQLTIEEMKGGVEGKEELTQLLKDYAKRIESGEKVIVKLKTTKSGASIVFYVYDKSLYRYQIVGEHFL